jgi:hypothetical protein
LTRFRVARAIVRGFMTLIVWFEGYPHLVFLRVDEGSEGD